MGAQELRHEARLMEWRELVAECRSSGETVTAWCREHGISRKTYYRWEKAVLTKAERQLAALEGASSPVFVPAPVYRERSGPLPAGPKIAARLHTAYFQRSGRGDGRDAVKGAEIC